MILHILFDDIFGDYAVQQFSGNEMCSEFVVVANSTNCSFIKERVNIVTTESEGFKELLSKLGHYKSIVFHGLFYPWQAEMLRAIPDYVKVAWVFWGGDIYNRRVLCGKFLTFRSKALLGFQSFKRMILKRRRTLGYEIPFELLKRIDYCLTDVQEDYQFVRQYLGTPIKELWYNYYSIDETIGDLVEETIDGADILVGNSCTIECNHLDGFRRLSHLDLGDSKIVVPLSYGDSWLRTFLLNEGERRFHASFNPLVEFIPRSEYNKIIKRCAIAVMPHYRPQAFGNILTALWLGAKVYLSEKNVLYSFFKRIGTVVFSIEHDLKKTNPKVLTPLSKEEILQNRKALSAVYRKEVMHLKNLELVNVLNQ